MDPHLEDLLRSLLETDPHGVLGDQSREAVVYAMLACSPTEKYEAVCKFANSIADEGKRSHLLNKVSALVAERMECDLSERIARSIPLNYWRYDALVKVARELLQRDRQFRAIPSYQPKFTDQAFRLLNEVEQNLSIVPEEDRSSIVWSAGLALIDAGELDWAQKLATSSEYCPENTYVLMGVAKVRAKQSDTAGAIQIARTVAELAGKGDHFLTNRVDDLEEVGELVSEFGDRAEALKYFEAAVQFAAASQAADDVDGCKCLAAVAIKFAKHGRIDRAREVASQVAQSALRDRVLLKIEELSLGIK